MFPGTSINGDDGRNGHVTAIETQTKKGLLGGAVVARLESGCGLFPGFACQKFVSHQSIVRRPWDMEVPEVLGGADGRASGILLSPHDRLLQRRSRSGPPCSGFLSPTQPHCHTHHSDIIHYETLSRAGQGPTPGPSISRM